MVLLAKPDPLAELALSQTHFLFRLLLLLFRLAAAAGIAVCFVPTAVTDCAVAVATDSRTGLELVPVRFAAEEANLLGDVERRHGLLPVEPVRRPGVSRRIHVPAVLAVVAAFDAAVAAAVTVAHRRGGFEDFRSGRHFAENSGQ